jgi:hypothetical protein
MAEATVDALVEVDAAGEVKDIEIVRWAGYGLNEAVTATVRRLHFAPPRAKGDPSPSASAALQLPPPGGGKQGEGIREKGKGEGGKVMRKFLPVGYRALPCACFSSLSFSLYPLPLPLLPPLTAA